MSIAIKLWSINKPHFQKNILDLKRPNAPECRMAESWGGLNVLFLIVLITIGKRGNGHLRILKLINR